MHEPVPTERAFAGRGSSARFSAVGPAGWGRALLGRLTRALPLARLKRWIGDTLGDLTTPAALADRPMSSLSRIHLDDLRPPDAPDPSVGCIDSILPGDGRLVIKGWLLADDGAAIDQLHVQGAGGWIRDAHVSLGLPSPEVAKHLGRGSDSPAAKARFELRLPLSVREDAQDRQGRPSGQILALHPSSRGRTLRPVVLAHDTAIPMPTDALALRIGGGFLEVATEFLAHFQQLAHVAPSDKVLEVGCGLGRMAYPLAYYLDDSGSYEGFDIDAELVAWASSSIGAARPNFRFVHADVHNAHYHPEGRLSPEAYRFPPADAAVDVVLAVSLFTHLPAAVAHHYLLETARVLRPGGTVFLTAFLLDDQAARGMAEGRAIINLGTEAAGGYVAEADNPEFAIGFPADEFLGWMAEAGLEVTAAFPGNWSGRRPFLSFQDIVVARRNPQSGAVGDR